MAISKNGPQIMLRGTKTEIEAETSYPELTGGYATDTAEVGFFTGDIWVWLNRAWGHMYQDDVGTTITVSATNTDYIVTGMSQGEVERVGFQNNRELVIQVTGLYLVVWSVSFSAANANQEIEGAVGVGGVRAASTSAHKKQTTANDASAIGGNGILDLAEDDLVQIVVRNETSASNIIVEHANISIVRIG